jgi:hypothetical protein
MVKVEAKASTTRRKTDGANQRSSKGECAANEVNCEA